MQPALPLDFILSFCKDMVPGNGEDSYCYSFCDTAGMLGVFDGCGGAGAKKHAFYSGKTEAYMASRLCAGAFYDSFREKFPCSIAESKTAAETFATNAVETLSAFAPPREVGDPVVLGSMVRTLPTTAAVALIQQESWDNMLINALWAGDSRVFLLDENGLCQLTTDDTSVPDPMENLYEDGVLKNIFCSDRRVKLHSKVIRVKPPFMVLAATDGCFGYVSTPMEFEGILLNTLLNANSVADWETRLADLIGQSAGDDHTLCLASFGYADFGTMQRRFAVRYAHLVKTYLNPICDLPVDDRQSRYNLWSAYQGNYMRYLKDDQT